MNKKKLLEDMAEGEKIIIIIIIIIIIVINQMNKKKLLEDMAEEESRNDNKLVELQRQRENERKILNSR